MVVHVTEKLQVQFHLYIHVDPFVIIYAFSLSVNIENIYLWFIFETFIQMVTIIIQSMDL